MPRHLLITACNLFFLPILLFFSSPVVILTAAAVPVPDPCAGRRIHIRRLPPRFNTDLLGHCSTAFPLADHPSSTPSCASLANHGLGPRTHNRTRSWHRTDGRLLEPFFHRRVLDLPCLAADPAAADAVFLPYYASLDALPFVLEPAMLNFSAIHGVPLAQFLERDRPDVLNRRHGHDHFLVLAGPAWDYAQPPESEPRLWGTTSILRRPEFVNFTFLTLESRAWPWQEHAVPHPTAFHPPTLPRLQAWIARARRSRRTSLMLYAGGVSRPSKPNIRGSILAECANRTDTGVCAVVDCSGGACALDPAHYMIPMLRSKFCLQPPGDTPTRRSTFDAVVAGCVPVFFEHASARTQYGWHLPPLSYDDFSVTIPKDSVVLGGVLIAETLAAVPETEVARMRARLLEMAPRVVYRWHGTSTPGDMGMDAVDIAVEGVLRRIRRRVKALRDGQVEAIYSMDDDDQEIM